VVKLGSHSYKLPASHLKVRANVNDMVNGDIIREASQGGYRCVLRDLTGRSVDTTVQPRGHLFRTLAVNRSYFT